jgi:hypothetical protein
MRRVAFSVLALSLLTLAAVPTPAAAEVQKAVIDILGGMQCSL